MRRTIGILAVLAASACSSGSGAGQQQQQRITELEQQNAQLQSELKQAKDNVRALQDAMNHSPAEDPGSGADAPAGQAVDPAPANNLAGQAGNP